MTSEPPRHPYRKPSAMWLAIWIVVVAEAIGFLWLVWLYSQGSIYIAFDKGSDVALLMLAASTLVVTGVGVGIALVAIWGFREIRDQAVDAAVKSALKAVQKTVRGAYESGTESPSGTDADAIALADNEDDE